MPTSHIQSLTATTVERVRAEQILPQLRAFIAEQAEHRTPETQLRYIRVVTEFERFVAHVDVTPWLGRELADLLADERARVGGGALIDSLGLSSLIRVLPAFLHDPWIPEERQDRRTARVVTRHITRFLRVQAVRHNCFRRHDFAALSSMLSTSYAASQDAQTQWGEGPSDFVTCRVELELRHGVVDSLMDDVSHGLFESLGAAIAARINPVPVTVWMSPDEADGYGRDW